jgi:hypothetical protein
MYVCMRVCDGNCVRVTVSKVLRTTIVVTVLDDHRLLPDLSTQCGHVTQSTSSCMYTTQITSSFMCIYVSWYVCVPHTYSVCVCVCTHTYTHTYTVGAHIHIHRHSHRHRRYFTGTGTAFWPLPMVASRPNLF